MRVSAGGLLMRASLRREREMMWMIAALPFWIIGAFYSVGALLSVFNRRPGETDRDIMDQLIFGLVIGGIMFVIAAKIAS
jgi:hypothetical protein